VGGAQQNSKDLSAPQATFWCCPDQGWAERLAAHRQVWGRRAPCVSPCCELPKWLAFQNRGHHERGEPGKVFTPKTSRAAIELTPF